MKPTQTNNEGIMMADEPFCPLSQKDEIMVIDAAAIVSSDDDEPAYTLLVDMADGRWFILNGVTSNATQAARLLHSFRKEGRIELSEWTDVSFLRPRCALDTAKALCVGRRPVLSGTHRPVHPSANEMSLLLEGDAVRIVRAVSPADETRSWWLVILSLTEGVVLQHVLPFETSDEALDLVKLMARTGAYVTEDFFDATEDMKSVDLDTSEEMEIDQDGKRRVH
jgi:hypothetical protein